MKIAIPFLLLLSNAVADTQKKTLSDYITDIPECSTAALKTGMEANKCKTSDIGPSTFDCLCTALHIIAPQAAEEITQTCYADLLHSLVDACHLWIGGQSSDSEKAASILEDKLSGNSPAATSSGESATRSRGSAAITQTEEPTATGSEEPATASQSPATESKSTNIAAAPTAVDHGIAGLLGGAVIMAGMLL